MPLATEYCLITCGVALFLGNAWLMVECLIGASISVPSPRRAWCEVGDDGDDGDTGPTVAVLRVSSGISTIDRVEGSTLVFWLLTAVDERVARESPQ